MVGRKTQSKYSALRLFSDMRQMVVDKLYVTAVTLQMPTLKKASNGWIALLIGAF